MRWLLLSLGAPLLMSVSFGCGESPTPIAGALRGTPGAEALWVMTYNVNFERPSDATVVAIAAAGADIVFLQETHAGWEGRIRASLEPQYPHILFRHAPNEGGMAILSRYPISEERHGMAPQSMFPSWRVSASTPQGELDILHVHLHPPLEDGSLVVGFFTTSEVRRDELMHQLSGRTPDLVLGDFNEGEGPALTRLTSLGMREAQTLWPPVELTWTWDTGMAELEGRPDHVFAGSGFQITAVQVMTGGGSDHRPLRVAIERRP